MVQSELFTRNLCILFWALFVYSPENIHIGSHGTTRTPISKYFNPGHLPNKKTRLSSGHIQNLDSLDSFSLIKDNFSQIRVLKDNLLSLIHFSSWCLGHYFRTDLAIR